MKKLIIPLLFISTFIHAVNQPEPDDNDHRLKTVVYKKDDIIPIYANYKKATLIDLGVNNKIIDIRAGDTESWIFELTADETGVFAKPVLHNPDTNLIVITDKRKYYFDLSMKKKKDIDTYGIKFVYPDEQNRKLQAKLLRNKSSSVHTDLSIKKSFPGDWNFGYVLKGNKNSSPVQIFDDGQFTYLDFGKKDIPAIFSVDADKREGVINFHKSGKYIVVENIYQQLTTRNGTESTCIYNKGYQLVMNADGDLDE